MKAGFEHMGRWVEVEAGSVDEHGQFLVTVSVDGKQRWGAWFTDKTDEVDEETAPN